MKNTFKRSALGWTLAVLNLLASLNSAYFFMGQLRSGVVGWLMMNTCAPSVFLFVLGFLCGSPMVMTAASVLMFRYGTLGLFVFAWDGYNIIPQIGHILMTLAVIYVLVEAIRNRRWKSLGWGVAVGVAILIPLIIVQYAWFGAHPGLMEQLFSGSLYPQRP
jgi:hypothetical protein